MLHAIDSEIVEAILRITEKKYSLVAIGKNSRRKSNISNQAICQQNGREYVLGHVSGAGGSISSGDRIRSENRSGVRISEV
ncbi:MAG: hypothetical protein ACLRWM_01045 [Streptococcus sp.]